MAPIESPSVVVFSRGSLSPNRAGAAPIVVWLRGEHDAFNTSELADILARAIALDDADVVLDLSGVEFMGAATVGVIVRAREFLGARSRSLTLQSPPNIVRRILELCSVAYADNVPPVVAARSEGAANALASWVAVPATDRADTPAESVAEAAVETDAAGVGGP